jgi:hypothetical protein
MPCMHPTEIFLVNLCCISTVACMPYGIVRITTSVIKKTVVYCYGYCGYNLQFPQLHSQQIIDDLKIFFYSAFVPNLGMTFGAVRLIHKVIQRYYAWKYKAKTCLLMNARICQFYKICQLFYTCLTNSKYLLSRA